MLFEKQYILTETVTTETRYRTETRTGYYTDADGNLQSYEYDVQVPYTYYICTVRLENFNLSHVPVYIMSQDQLSLYAMYMATLGNRPDLFGGSEYIGKYYTADYEKYEIPQEELEDAQFTAIIKEAEKYLGYPYVWGGSTPATSFDCSGFVSYVYNNCGVGWSFGQAGRFGAAAGICTRVSAANLRPGDLVFFQGTYDTAGASHVGIYVGNNMMLHCGDPIQYTSLNSSYWQSHFLAYGRLYLRPDLTERSQKMNPKITKLKAERAKNDEKIAALRSRNRELDESIVELENTDIIGLARATGMSMEELAQFLTQLKRGGAPFITPNTKEDTDYVHEEE